MIFVLCTTIPVFAGESNQDYTGAKATLNGKNPLVDGRFTLLTNEEKSNGFVVEAVDVTETSAKLKWSSDTGYLGYRVFIYNPLVNNFEEYATTNKTSVLLPKLESNTSYVIMIASKKDNKDLGTVEFTTKSLKPVIEISDVTSKAVTLEVENTYDDAKLVLYRKSGDGDYKEIANLGKKRTYVDRKVKQRKDYKYKVKSVSSNGASMSKSEKTTVPVKMGLPKVSGATKTYAYYTAVTVKSSPQYKLLNSEECYTDEKTGIRMVDDCYCVALGSYYGSKIGTKYRIKFSTGNSINVILCDQKANRHTDSNNQYAMRNKDIMEFYVEKSKIPKSIRGNYGNLPQFRGSIVSIEKFAD